MLLCVVLYLFNSNWLCSEHNSQNIINDFCLQNDYYHWFQLIPSDNVGVVILDISKIQIAKLWSALLYYFQF